jgi:hypothetical protein
LASAEPRNCRANYWLQESRFSHSHSYEAEVVKLAQKANVAPAPHVGYSRSGLSHRYNVESTVGQRAIIDLIKINADIGPAPRPHDRDAL